MKSYLGTVVPPLPEEKDLPRALKTRELSLSSANLQLLSATAGAEAAWKEWAAKRENLMELVRQEKLDMAIVDASDRDRSLHFRKLYQRDFFVAMPCTHPLAIRSYIEPQEVISEPQVVFNYNVGKSFKEWTTGAPADESVLCTVNTAQSALDLVAAGVGHQHPAVAVQNVAAGGLNTGDGGKGGSVVHNTAGFHNLQVIHGVDEEGQHQTENQQQQHRPDSAYSFHVSPPILLMALTKG